MGSEEITVARSWPVVGHEWAVNLLQQAIAAGRPSHAYLLAGRAQIGKTTLARAFAQALECERTPGTPCQVCRACRLIAQGRYADVQIIAAEKNTIQIEQIRNLQADAMLSPVEGRYRIFIIREIERATAPAANALLKTLEEPGPQVILVLTCVRPDLVLSTILSRCQVLSLRPLPEAQLAAALVTGWQMPAEEARLLARLSSGRLGWAVDARTDAGLWAERAQRLDDLMALATQDDARRLSYSEELSRQPAAAEKALGLWATWWRDLMLVQNGLASFVVNLDRSPQLQVEAERYRSDQVQRALVDVTQTLRRIHANVNIRLALDVWALRLPHPLGPRA